MHPTVETSNEFEASLKKYKEACEYFAASLKGEAECIDLAPGEGFPEALGPFLIEKGSLECLRSGTLVMLYERPDLIFGTLSEKPRFEMRSSALGCRLRRIDFNRDLDALELEQRFARIQAAHTDCLWSLVESSRFEQKSFEPEFLEFEAGDTILHEGDLTDQVMTMLDGEASVQLGGKEVGCIKSGEIFGALSVLTGAPRSASVVARTYCQVHSLKSQDFEYLFKTHSKASLQLVKDMAQIIRSLNEKLVRT